MAETRSPFVRPGEALDYQPVAVPAVLAALVAGAALVSTVALVAHGLSSGKAAVFPLVMLLGALGLFLASVARASIKRSEGTRAGLGMASAAWWASLASLIGYGAYAFGSESAIRSQSVAEAKKFFDFLDPNPNGAFLLTVEPARRANIPPEDAAQIEAEYGATGQLSQFRNSELVRLFRRNPKQVKFDFQGVKAWEQTPTGYVVIQTWKVSSPEGGFVADLPVFATENKETGGRLWHVGLPNDKGLGGAYRTRYGVAVAQILRESEVRAGVFCAALAGPDKGRAYEMSLPPERVLARQAVASPVVLFLPAPPVPEGFFATFLQPTGGGPPPPAKADEFRAVWTRGALNPPNRMSPDSGETQPDVAFRPEGVEARVPVEALLDPTSPNGKIYRGHLLLDAPGSALGAKLAELKAEALADPTKAAADDGVLKELPARPWRVAGYLSDMTPRPLPSRNPGPGGPPRGREKGP